MDFPPPPPSFRKKRPLPTLPTAEFAYFRRQRIPFFWQPRKAFLICDEVVAPTRSKGGNGVLWAIFTRQIFFAPCSFFFHSVFFFGEIWVCVVVRSPLCLQTWPFAHFSLVLLLLPAAIADRASNTLFCCCCWGGGGIFFYAPRRHLMSKSY